MLLRIRRIDIHGILYLIRNDTVILLGKIESLKRVLCFETGRRVERNLSLAQFGSINRTSPNGRLTPHRKLIERSDSGDLQLHLRLSTSQRQVSPRTKKQPTQRNSCTLLRKRNGPGCGCPIWRDASIGFPWFQPFLKSAFLECFS